MSLAELKDRFMAIPWVYDKVRPLVIGTDYYKTVARFCRIREEDRVFDLGCGTGRLLEFIQCESYLGADLDRSALKRARKNFSANHIHFVAGEEWDEPLRKLDPTVVLMLGLVHHISDEEFRATVERIRSVVKAPRIITLDTTVFPGNLVSNLLSRMDRGRYVRRQPAYEALFQECGLRITFKEAVFTRPPYVGYIGYHLEFNR
jgi:SAM-dependent methyltransferase